VRWRGTLTPQFAIVIFGETGVEGQRMQFRIQDHAPRLQAACGIAALCVTVGHCCITFVNGRIEKPTFQLSGSDAILAVGQGRSAKRKPRPS
jgi:hypothetical protein